MMIGSSNSNSICLCCDYSYVYAIVQILSLLPFQPLTLTLMKKLYQGNTG